MSALIEAAALQQLITHDPAIKILDASYGQAPYPDCYLPNTCLFDIDEVADRNAPFTHTIPTNPQQIETLMAQLNIHHQDNIVIYDQTGLSMAASRAWWMLRYFGHQGDIRVLNGGLPAWLRMGGVTENAPSLYEDIAAYTADIQSELLTTYQDIHNQARNDQSHLMDARATIRFEAGAIPNSVNIPFMALLNDDGTMKKTDETMAFFTDLPEKTLIATCGSGVTACVIALALHELGHQNCSIYDGSWTEWSAKL